MKDSLKEQMKVVYELLGDDELTTIIADMLWSLYQKLKKKGFTDKQAMSVVLQYSNNQTK